MPHLPACEEYEDEGPVHRRYLPRESPEEKAL